MWLEKLTDKQENLFKKKIFKKKRRIIHNIWKQIDTFEDFIFYKSNIIAYYVRSNFYVIIKKFDICNFLPQYFINFFQKTISTH